MVRGSIHYAPVHPDTHFIDSSFEIGVWAVLIPPPLENPFISLSRETGEGEVRIDPRRQRAIGE
jgi:hypothetical protein